MTDARDRSDAVIVRWTPIGRATRRYRFEPHSAGGWTAYEEVRARGEWRPVGTESVEELDIENPPEQ